MKTETRSEGVSGFTSRISRGVPAVIITFSFFLSAFLINTRPFGLAELKDITGGPGIPDMALFYTPATLSPIIEALGPGGRDFYLTRIIPLDLLFPLCYTLFFMVVLFRLMECLEVSKSRWTFLLFIPILAGTADYAENLCFLSILLTYPDHLTGVASIASLFSGIKWICTPACFLLILLMTAGWVKKRFVPVLYRVSHLLLPR